MTVAGLFKAICKLTIISAISFVIFHLFIANSGLNTFPVSFQNYPLFALSFIVSILFLFFMFIGAIFYLSRNSHKSVAIVLSYSYLKENYWKDVNGSNY